MSMMTIKLLCIYIFFEILSFKAFQIYFLSFIEKYNFMVWVYYFYFPEKNLYFYYYLYFIFSTSAFFTLMLFYYEYKKRKSNV